MKRAWLSAVAAVLLPLSPGHTQPPPQLGRLLGVFDDATGQPVAGASIIDLASGSSTTTSLTGTATLAWLEPGTSLLQVRKLGYASRMLPVNSSPTDTSSITVVLTPLAPTLPTVVTRARASADTVRALERAGFYERKYTTGAPSQAFVTAEQLERAQISWLKEVKQLNGRGICGEIFVNGMHVENGIRLDPGDWDWRKMELRAEDVVGIETYYGAEVPAQFNVGERKKGNARSRCTATLIWTK